MNDRHRLALLEISCTIQRLRLEISLIEKFNILCCTNCGEFIAKQSDIFSMWNLLFEDNYANCDLANLISVQSLIKSIEIAKVKDINLVIILPMNAGPVEYLGESPDPDITNNFMIITGLEKVSHMETKTYSNGEVYNNDIIKEVRWKNSEFDTRCHHLCNTNNQVLADLILQGFDGQKGIHDLSEQPGLNFDEIEKYAELIYK